MHPIPLIIGATAVGKTDASLELADRLDAEIVSVDSRQIYRELCVGTAKPTAEEQRGITHHFVDEISLPEVVSAGWFEQQANDRIAEVFERGKRVVAVGGSTLYVHALTAGLPSIPPIDARYVDELNADILAGLSHALFEELQQADPAFAATLDPTKTQRIVRGVSVFRATGRPLSSFFGSAAPRFKFNILQVTRPRDELYSRINERVNRMVDSGLLDEAKGILDTGFDQSLSPLRTIGYREAFDYLTGAVESKSEFVRLLQRNTRRYAKRQITWMRRYPESTIISADAPHDDFYERATQDWRQEGPASLL